MSSPIDRPREELLLELLVKEHGYYCKVLDIANEENSRLQVERPLADVQPLLKQKQVLLNEIQILDNALAPLKRYWQSKKDRSDPLSSQIQQELASLNQLLSDILVVDISTQQYAEKHLKDLKRQCSKRLEEQ